MWSVGCIMAEMYIRHELFQGDCEINFARLILSVVPSSYSELIEAGYDKLNIARSFKGIVGMGGGLKNHMYSRCKKLNLPSVEISNPGFDLLANFFHMDPVKRISAREALEHVYQTFNIIAIFFRCGRTIQIIEC